MQLHEVRRGTHVRVIDQNVRRPPGDTKALSETILFHHIDGMYSYCTHEDGTVVHLAAWTEVEIVEVAK